VLAIDLDYWSKRDLLEIPRLGCEHLGVHVDSLSLTMFATEAAGSPQLMQSICLWMCDHLGVRETVDPSRAVTLDEAARKEILNLTSKTVDWLAGARVCPGRRRGPITQAVRPPMAGATCTTQMRACAIRRADDRVPRPRSAGRSCARK
jgi:hypothetical protein